MYIDCKLLPKNSISILESIASEKVALANILNASTYNGNNFSCNELLETNRTLKNVTNLEQILTMQISVVGERCINCCCLSNPLSCCDKNNKCVCDTDGGTF